MNDYIREVKKRLKEHFIKDNNLNYLKEFHFSAIYSPVIANISFEKYAEDVKREKFYLSKDMKELIILGLFYSRNYQNLMNLFEIEKDGIIRGKTLDLLVELLPFEENRHKKVRKLLNMLQDVVFSETHSLFFRKKSIKAYAKLLAYDRKKMKEFLSCILEEMENGRNRCFYNPYKVRYLSINLDILQNISIDRLRDKNIKNNLKDRLKVFILSENSNGLLKYKAFSCITHLFSEEVFFIKDIVEELLKVENRRYPLLIEKIVEFVVKSRNPILKNLADKLKNKEEFRLFLDRVEKKSEEGEKSLNTEEKNNEDTEKLSEIIKYIFINKLKKLTFNSELITEDFDSFHRDLKEHFLLLKRFREIQDEYLEYPNNIRVIYNLLYVNAK